ncbi:hypothetical protein [Devosia ginsengisoli]|uniref:hypothetical protein n=1 Tax=Devosia ginsengisoli TaxID=400770 RepID=UPI0026F18FD7|nr:hypothetical protein [Devosia ginsengisoli]MCR6671498.1 hypothetical protein [Devosia ginsengisoli]
MTLNEPPQTENAEQAAPKLQDMAAGLTKVVSRMSLSDFLAACSMGQSFGLQPTFIRDVLPADTTVAWSALNDHQIYIVVQNLAAICERLASEIERRTIAIMVAAATSMQMEGGGSSKPRGAQATAAQPAPQSERASTRARPTKKYVSDIGLYLDDFERCRERNSGKERWQNVVCYLFLLAALATALQKLIPFAPAPPPSFRHHQRGGSKPSQTLRMQITIQTKHLVPNSFWMEPRYQTHRM